MSEEPDIEKLARSEKVVVFRSPLTDLGGLDLALARRGTKWRSVDLAMSERDNRERFEALRRYTGHPTLPQVFIDGEFMGGIRAARDALEDESALEGPSPTLSGAAAVAGYASLVPFVGLAAWMWTRHGGIGAHVLAVYAAVALAFIGAVHFGWALGEHADGRRYWWSMLPALLAWILASLPPGAGLPLLAATVLGVWYAERRWFAKELPRWFRGLRIQLSFVAAACLLAAWIAVLVRG